jgi:homogentisate 1,2-dioxygenase
MKNQAFCNNDGDFLILPQVGKLDIQTELGRLMVNVGELCVIQAGIRWRVSLPDGKSRGYVHEIFGSHFELPDLGVIGSNGLAHPRDFEFPVAAFDMDKSKWQGLCNVFFTIYYQKTNRDTSDIQTNRQDVLIPAESYPV